MALEDAAILAKCLRDIPDLNSAFATYEQLRRERTKKMFEAGKHGDAGKHAIRPMQQWFRDLTTPIFLKLFVTPKVNDWLYSYRVDWEAPVIALGSTKASSKGQEMSSHVGAR